MVTTQIELPDELFAEANRVARERKISLAEVVRRGVEYMTKVYPSKAERPRTSTLPPADDLGECLVPVAEWRHLANDPTALAE